MAPSFLLRICPLASVAAAAPALGCGPGEVDDQGFRITAVDYDGYSLTLTFSQPLANADAIDANDFRISFARTSTSSYQNPGPHTFYQDIGYAASYYVGGAPERFEFASASSGASANQLVLADPSSLLAKVCNYLGDYIVYYQNYVPDGVSRDIGFLLHYAAGGMRLESESGEPLADIGADWVLSPDSELELDSYGFVNLDPKLLIPC